MKTGSGKQGLMTFWLPGVAFFEHVDLKLRYNMRMCESR
jgi:hypothetical protein